MKYCVRLLGLLLIISALCEAQIPRTISYQGILTDTLGRPKADGNWMMTFRFYEASSGGNALWSDNYAVMVKRGLFSTILGGHTALPDSMTFDQQYWLSIQVGADPEMSPRIPLTAVAYSLHSVNSDTAKYVLSGSPGGLDTITADNRYVKLKGGTMSNGLTINHAAGSGSSVYGLYVTDNTSNAIYVTENANWAGIYCVNPSTGSAWGVSGIANSSNGSGITGSSDNGSGVVAKTIDGTALAATVNSGGTGHAAVFTGPVDVIGALSKSSGSFKIDHPLDPANKYLSHSFVESPDMMNVYNGNIITDGNGEATVILPGYFQALNRDFRYQLTVIGQFAQAIIQSEIQNNQFTIKTDKPNVKVSWQVTGIRQDSWANDHRIQVEENKPAKELGTYIYPQGHGQSASKGVNYSIQVRGDGAPTAEDLRSMQNKER